MSQSHKNKILIVGAGQLTESYIDVLKFIGAEITVIGNRKSNVNKISRKYNCISLSGGIENNLSYIEKAKFTHAIIASPTKYHVSHAKIVFKHNVPNILVEKPASFSPDDLKELKNKNIYIAYNRRFYNSSIYIRENFSKSDFKTVHLDFSERIKNLDSRFDNMTIRNWLIANSSHLFDLVFNLVGFPDHIKKNLTKVT